MTFGAIAGYVTRSAPFFANLVDFSPPQSSRHHAGRPPLTEHLSHLSP